MEYVLTHNPIVKHYAAELSFGLFRSAFYEDQQFFLTPTVQKAYMADRNSELFTHKN